MQSFRMEGPRWVPDARRTQWTAPSGWPSLVRNDPPHAISAPLRSSGEIRSMECNSWDWSRAIARPRLIYFFTFVQIWS